MFEDVEHFLEGVLDGMKARKEIEPLRKKIAELESKITDLATERDSLDADKKSLSQQVADLTNQRDNFKTQLNDAQENFYRKENNLREDFKRQLAESERRLVDAQKDFNRQLNEQSDYFNRQLDDANNNLNNAVKARQAAERTADFYRDTYSELNAAFKIYQTLDDSTRFDLAGIFGAGDTAAGFFSGAVQESHLSPFWDYVSRHADNENLSRLFDFCFEMVNRGFREPPYSRLNVEQGNYFDSDFMRRTSQSRQMGNVVRVVLQGYQYSEGNVIKKSVIELG